MNDKRKYLIEKYLGEDIIDLDKERDDRNIRKFHGEMMGKIKDSVVDAMDRIEKARSEGKLIHDVGTRVQTAWGRENGQAPWKITGHYVDKRDPNKYGYHVERGEGDTYERSMMQANVPGHEEETWHVYGRPKG